MWGKIIINANEEKFFKTKNFKPDGRLISMKYSDNYIDELINSAEIYKKNKSNNALRITIKEVS